MSSYFYKKLVSKICILLLSLFFSISHADTKISSDGFKGVLLTDKQVKLLELSSAKALPECYFIYDKTKVGTITDGAIYECIEVFSAWFAASNREKLGLSKQQDINFRILDNYLGKRVLPYVLKLPKTGQSRIFRKIMFYYVNNSAFIHVLMEQGLSVKDVLLQQISEESDHALICKYYKFFLAKNLKLYQNNRTLYEPIPDMNGTKDIKPAYRWEDLHHLTDTTYRNYTCYTAIDQLVKANSELLNKKHSYDGATPLHYYLRNLFRRNAIDIQLIKKLATSSNINMKSNDGNTPLHEFLINTNPAASTDKQIIDLMTALGADITIKNKKGVSVKELIIKRQAHDKAPTFTNPISQPTVPNIEYPPTLVKSRCVYVESMKWFTCPHGRDPDCSYRIRPSAEVTHEITKICAAKRPSPRQP